MRTWRTVREKLVRRRHRRALVLLLVCLPVVLCVAAGVGAYPIAPWKVPGILFRHAEAEGFRILAYIRFPRVALSAIVGASLACAGASLQGLFRNPLADPGLLGVTSGAAVGAALWIVVLSGGWLGIWGLPVAAFAGSALVVSLIWRLARNTGRMATATLLLAGIALNSIAGAIIGLLTFLADSEELRGLTFWQLGGFSHATWPLTILTLVLCTGGLAVLLRAGNALNALTLGEAEAYNLGVSTEAVKRRIVFGCAVTVGAGVAAAGGIGFVGLVVPHLLRITVGADHRWLLPGSAIAGAILLTAADLGARTVALPAEMPVGIITAVLGGPFFLWLLIRYRRELVHA